MNVRDLQDRLLAIVPDARVSPSGPIDDLYPFRFASATFVPPYMAALVRVLLTVDADGTARTQLLALSGLLEEALADGDDLADALAMRLIHARLCAQPELLSGAWPHLGTQTRRIAGKFLRLAEECDRREAAARAQSARPQSDRAARRTGAATPELVTGA